MFDEGNWLDPAGRLLIALSFLVSALFNAPQARDHVEHMADFHVPFPGFAFRTGMVLLFAGCAMLLTGWRADIGAVCLIVFALTATAIYPRYWTRADPARRTASRIARVGNTSVVGGLLLLLQNLR